MRNIILAKYCEAHIQFDEMNLCKSYIFMFQNAGLCIKLKLWICLQYDAILFWKTLRAVRKWWSSFLVKSQATIWLRKDFIKVLWFEIVEIFKTVLYRNNFWSDVLFLLGICDILEVFLIKLLRQLPWCRPIKTITIWLIKQIKIRKIVETWKVLRIFHGEINS